MSENVILKHRFKILYNSSGGVGGGGVKDLASYGSIPHAHCHDCSILNFITIIIFNNVAVYVCCVLVKSPHKKLDIFALNPLK
jgi:hypothetical protein